MALLGELEGAVMGVLWAGTTPLTVRQVHEVLTADRDLAYTTVLTVLDRLAKKELVSRRAEQPSRAWVYQPVHSRAELVARELTALLAEAGADANQALALFADGLSPDSRAELAGLLAR